MIYPENGNINSNKQFPTINENPPLAALLKAGKKVEDVVVGEDWTDDHCPCYNLCVTVEGQEYGVSVWWLSTGGLRLIFRAEASIPADLEELTKMLVEGID